MNDTPDATARPRGLPVAAAFAAVYLAVVATMIVLDVPGDPRSRADQDRYHLEAIRRFASEMPRPDVSDYLSATTPGYHVALAAIGRYVDDAVVTLRLAGAVFGLVLVAVWGWVLGRRAAPAHAIALGLPLVASLYVLAAGVWLLPDNAGWLGVLVILALSLGRPGHAALAAGGGIALVYAVAMRQVHLWAAAPLWVAGWFATRGGERGSRWPCVARVAAFTAPAFGVVLLFAIEWGGLVPPTFQRGATDLQGPNPATPVLLLVLLGGVTWLYAGYWWTAAVETAGGSRRLTARLTLVGVAAALLAAAPATSFDPDAGRLGNLWRIGDAAVIADRSLVLVALAALGAAGVAGLLHAVDRPTRWVAATALLAFAAAQSANADSFQRYLEPFAVMWVALPCAALCGGAEKPPRFAAAGPLLLAGGLAGVTAVKFL